MRDSRCSASEIQAPFIAARAQLDQMADHLSSGDLMHAPHDEVERYVAMEGRELLRLLLCDHFQLRGQAQPVGPVVGMDGHIHTHRRDGTRCTLITTVGHVPVPRTAFSGRGLAALHPTDAALNLPAESYSFELQKQVAKTAAEVSFERASGLVDDFNGVQVPLRQVEGIAQAAARDFDSFYEAQLPSNSAPAPGDLLVISSDGKGVVMRKESLREATRRKAEAATHALTTRLAKGEKPNKKRMAVVAAVYTIAPHLRTAKDVVAGLRHLKPVPATPRVKPPRPKGKRVWASLVDDLHAVVAQQFDEAQHRDPEHQLPWFAVMDGDVKLERAYRAEAKRRGVQLTLILDFIHGLEYLWRAGHALHKEGSPELEQWVLERLELLLQGKASDVAAGMRRSATLRELSDKQRKPIDTAADYFLKRKDMMRYDEFLAVGAPIASGVIEGTCRSLINDRLDLTGARWSVTGAEAVLRLRAILRSGDWEEYWAFHTQAEYVVNHQQIYAACSPPEVRIPRKRSHLRLVRQNAGVSS